MNTTKILQEAYQKFLLPIGGKLIPTPYRINIPANEHPARQGKSDPEVIRKQVEIDAKAQGFDLEKATVEEIRDFMKKNNLGIDCSGFAYRLLDHLSQKLHSKSLIDFNLPNVGRTNAAILTSDKFSKPIQKAREVKPGDLINMTSTIWPDHCLAVLSNDKGIITYAHSVGESNPDGVHTAKIKVTNPNGNIENQNWEEKFTDLNFTGKNTGVRRLKFI